MKGLLHRQIFVRLELAAFSGDAAVLHVVRPCALLTDGIHDVSRNQYRGSALYRCDRAQLGRDCVFPALRDIYLYTYITLLCRENERFLSDKHGNDS